VNTTLATAYKERLKTVLVPSAKKLEALLVKRFAGAKRVDRIYARAKSVDSFLKKSAKRIGKKPKYADPYS
jgi:hypothetical protein